MMMKVTFYTDVTFTLTTKLFFEFDYYYVCTIITLIFLSGNINMNISVWRSIYMISMKTFIVSG